MKIVLFPGVGFIEDTSKYEDFLLQVTKGISCDIEIFNWKHEYLLPEIALPYTSYRKWFAEVILDFQQIVKYADQMEVPEADIYMGHSAGSVLALAQKGKPCILYGSPAALVEIIQDDGTIRDYIKDDRPILNVVNKYDLIAYTIDSNNVENVICSGRWFNPFTYFPISAHFYYWTSKSVVSITKSKLSKLIE